ncbi:class I SAM-dependent methyltransferase [Aeromonas bestiarum]|uniref:Class I SAM-dependent methyltransferase n=1 Tax=Aeromonas bestiarum TaxID=105751 RepID=A0ABT7PU95_9GAMM|nr:class I SAM-dependent methyltransferase [Aeromonas bestiarum]MDM5070528.1 class I SAM-dependent methyltransferase [Aeromonas bestiarum]
MDSQQNSQSVENRELHPITQVDGELDFIFKRSLFWRPTYLAQSAWLEHIPFAFWLLETLRPKNIVELGTHYGSSYFSFCQAVTKLDLETFCFAVDTWGGDEHAGQYGEEVYKQVSEYNQQHYSGFSTLIRSTFDQALDHFPQGSIDLLHIDGLHTFDAVRHDFESWLPKLSEKAVVIMHDTNVRERGFGVFQLLDELKQQYPHFEFAHGHGLGVIGVGSEQAAQMQNLYGVSENARATKKVQDIFYRLGKSCGESWENSQLKQQLATQQEELQAEHQQLVEQQALERGRLAERITAQHHSLSALENQLAHVQTQADELALAQQHVNSLTSEMALLQQQVDEAQTSLSLGEQQRAQEQANMQGVEQTLETTSRQLAQVTAELDQHLAEKQSLLVQQSQVSDELKTARHQLEQQHDHIATQDRAQHQLQQQLNAQALQLSEETQRAAQLTLALSKSNGALTEHSRQLTALQLQLEQALHTQDTQTRALAERDNTVNLLQQRANALLQQLDDEGQTKSQLQRAYGLLEVQHDTLGHEHDLLKQVNANLQQQLEEGQLAQQTLQLCIDEQTLALAAASQQRDELTHTVAAHEGTIVEQSHALAVQQAECQQLRETLSALHQQLALEQTAHQQQISDRDQVLAERFSETATLTRLLEEQTQTIAEQSHEMAVQQAECQQLTETLSALHQQLALEQTTHQQQISERDLALAERFSETATLTRLLEEQTQTIAEQSQAMAVQQAERQQLTEAMSALQQQLTVEQTAHQKQISDRDQALAERFSETATLTRLLEEQAQTIAEQEAETQLLVTRLSGVEQQLGAEQALRQQAQAALVATTEEKQQQLDELERVLSERFSEIATLTRWLEEREQALLSAASEQQQANETYRAQQQAWQAEQERLTRDLTQLQRQLADVQQQAQRRQVELEEQARELTARNEGLEANITERFQELATMTRHMEQLSRELQQKERQLQQAKERAQNLKKTVSWKLTAPVRALGRTFKENPAGTTTTESAAERIAASGLFDELWYQHRYPEVADTALSALEHFINVGADKGYSPSELFDTRWYLQTYPDVAQGAINPLLHYIMHGKAEQRHCLPINKGK